MFANNNFLPKPLTTAVAFDDERVNHATKCIRKEDGINPGYQITTTIGTFTIKQGSTVGNTLSEVFSAMVLNKIVHIIDDVHDNSRTRVANAFLVVKNRETTNISIEDNCKTRLYAASCWSSDKVSFKACQLFGLKTRVKAAGTRQADDFKDLLELNKTCDLGLEMITIPTALIADFDMHTENFMLKINDQNIKDKDKKMQFDGHIKIFEQYMNKMPDITRQERLTYLKGIIDILKKLGANVFFHKIDHDSGFYRYADPKRKVDFLTHRTSPVHRIGIFFKTQPTLHLTEITGGTKEGMDQLWLSDKSIERLLKVDLDHELAIVLQTAGEFFEVIREKSQVLAGENHNAAEFYLLNEFYYHIKEESIPMPEHIGMSDLDAMKHLILEQLKLGTQLKVKDIHEQIYNRLLEKERMKETLTEKQMQLKVFLEKQNYLISTAYPFKLN